MSPFDIQISFSHFLKLQMYEGKPVLSRYQLHWYPNLSSATQACDSRNRCLIDHAFEFLYVWPREISIDRKRDYVVETPRVF